MSEVKTPKKVYTDKLELLQDTINYFWGKPERRCIKNGVCLYKPTETSEGCAIGRLLELSLAESLPNKSISATFHLLPTWLQNLGYDFLNELQLCHDVDLYGQKEKRAINRTFQNFVDVSKLTFPE